MSTQPKIRPQQPHEKQLMSASEIARTLVRLAHEEPTPVLGELSKLPSGGVPAPGELIQAEDFRWRSVDGLEIQGWLYRARGAARGTILHIHGGPT